MLVMRGEADALLLDPNLLNVVVLNAIFVFKKEPILHTEYINRLKQIFSVQSCAFIESFVQRRVISFGKNLGANLV